jgi:putative dimethyl sulfoxide reductase chaperone
MDHKRLQLTTRAELHLCLSRAFLPPTQAADFDALRDDLPADLADMNTELQWIDAPQLSRLGEVLASVPDHVTLLKTYSRLFLAPPAPALLNLAFYLDGALMGSNYGEIERLYTAHGLARDPAFRDTLDHLALYLQFLAWAFARAQEHLEAGQTAEADSLLADVRGSIARHGGPAILRLITQIEKAENELGLAPVYGQLAALTRQLLVQDAALIDAMLPAGSPEASATRAPTPARRPAGGHTDEQISCTNCGKTFTAGGELATMIAALAAHGLSTDHMSACPACQAQAMGMGQLKPPALKNKRQRHAYEGL